jgi:hypothetical protein
VRRKINPEELPPAEDVKKVERRLSAEQKTLPKETKRIAAPVQDQQLIFDAVDDDGAAERHVRIGKLR